MAESSGNNIEHSEECVMLHLYVNLAAPQVPGGLV